MPDNRRNGRKNDVPAKRGRRAASGATEKNKTAFKHMTELVKWVDLVIEVLDARLPISTRHPRADEIFGSSPHLLVLTKEDLADPAVSKKFVNHLEKTTRISGKLLSLRSNKGKTDLIESILKATAEKQEKLARRGILPRPMRICVVGLPNVGKSSLINWMIGKKKTVTGNRPGITLGTQWVRVHPQLELLDTPGILPPVAFTSDVASKLAMLNLLPSKNYNQEDVARKALELLNVNYPERLNLYTQVCDKDKMSIQDTFDNCKTKSEFENENEDEDEKLETKIGLETIAKARNLIKQGATLDLQRASAILLQDIREGKLGRLTLDFLP